MSEHHKQHHHRRPRCHRGEAWHRSHSTEQCASGPSFRRRFATREERIARLGTYLGELQAEAKAVEERIAELEAAGNS